MPKTYMDRQVRYVESPTHPLYAIKAYIAMVGAAVSALLASGVFGAVDTDNPVVKALTVISVLATALTTYKFPNAEVAEPQDPPSHSGFSPYDRDEADVQEPYGEGDTGYEGDEEDGADDQPDEAVYEIDTPLPPFEGAPARHRRDDNPEERFYR